MLYIHVPGNKVEEVYPSMVYTRMSHRVISTILCSSQIPEMGTPTSQQEGCERFRS